MADKNARELPLNKPKAVSSTAPQSAADGDLYGRNRIQTASRAMKEDGGGANIPSSVASSGAKESQRLCRDLSRLRDAEVELGLRHSHVLEPDREAVELVR